MANLKVDLINKVNNEKYFQELELIRLSQDPNMNYKQKIDEMSMVFSEIAILNAQLGLIDTYFKEPVAPQSQISQQPAEVPQGHAHPGQTHGE